MQFTFDEMFNQKQTHSLGIVLLLGTLTDCKSSELQNNEARGDLIKFKTATM